MKIWLWFKEIKRELIHMVDLLRDRERESEMHSLKSKWRKSILFTLLQNAKERIHSTPNNTFVYWAQSIQNHFSYFMQETFRFFLSSSDKLFSVSPRLIRSGSVNVNVGDGWICFWFPLNSMWKRRLLHFCGFAFRNICSVFSCISPFDFTAQWFYSSIFILVLVFHLRNDSYVFSLRILKDVESFWYIYSSNWRQKIHAHTNMMLRLYEMRMKIRRMDLQAVEITLRMHDFNTLPY